MALIVALNGLLDELDCMKRIINIKTTLLNFPGKIISTKETEDIQSYFQEFERKIESYFRTFLSEKEKDAKSKKPKTLEAKERFKEIENLFDKVRTTEKAILSKADFLINEFNKRERELFSGQIIPRKKKVILNDGRKEENEVEKTEKIEGNENPDIGNEEGATKINNVPPLEPKKEEFLIVEKIFLNTKMTINDVDILQKKETLDEEKAYISQVFDLKNLFENSLSKQYIMLDYYMNIYNFCIDNNFTLQQISTIMSIFYFIFSYSISWVSTEEKISEIFQDIICYHTLNNPPFSHKIFEKNQKSLLINFFENTFIKNFSFFEVLFRLDVSVCFFNQVLTKADVNTTDTSSQNKVELKKSTVEKNLEDIENNEEDEENKKEDEKSLDEIQDEKEIEQMKNFVNSFYQAVGDFEMQRTIAKENAIKGKNAEEANQAKMFLELKVPEIKKDINDLIDVQTRSVIKPVEKEMAEKAAAKGGKK